jgi:hypothetical protein
MSFAVSDLSIISNQSCLAAMRPLPLYSIRQPALYLYRKSIKLDIRTGNSAIFSI